MLAAPVWTSDVIDTLSNGYGFNIIYREYDYYNRWKLIPVYEKGVDYIYNYDYKSENVFLPLVRLQSSILNGISVTYDLSSIASMNSNPQFSQYNFYQDTINAFSEWSSGNRLITVSPGSSTYHKVAYSLGEAANYGIIESSYYSNPLLDNYGEIFNSCITINYTNIKDHCDENAYDYSNVWQSVVAHEIGHALGLDDIIVTADQTSIMASNRNRNTDIGPSNCDVAGVKKLYMKEDN